MKAAYASSFWMTFKQAQELGAHVRKGEQGQLWSSMPTPSPRPRKAKTDSDEERKIPFMKGYAVFNVEQIEGLPEHYHAVKA